MSVIRMTQHARRLATLMMEIGEGYRSDIALYLDCIFGNKGSGLNEIRKWEKNDLLNIRYIHKGKANTGDSSYRVITLSPAGRLFIAEALGKELSEQYIYKKIEEANIRFDTTDNEKIKTGLLDNRIKMAFEAAGVPALTGDKPNLCDLYSQLSSASLLIPKRNYSNIKNKDMYMQTSLDEYKALLETGIYYTIAEVRNLFDSISPESSDATLMSRARGIFISNKNCYVVYISKRGSNKNIKITKKAEMNLLRMLTDLLKITNVRRTLPDLSMKTLTNSGRLIFKHLEENSPYALVLADSDNMVYRLGRRFAYSDGTGTEDSGTAWLVGNYDLYKRVYVASYTIAGIQSIMYLCTHTLEEWHEDAKENLSRQKGLKVTDYNPFFPAICQSNGASVLYMPVYEMNTLEKIRNEDKEYGIVAYSDMFNPISKHVSKKILFYDIEEEVPASDIANVVIYDDNGYPKGKNMIIEALREEKKQCSLVEINKLPAKYGFKNPVEFFNKIALGTDDVPKIEDIVLQLETKPSKKFRKTKTKQMSISLDDKFKEKLLKAAKLYNLSISRYIKLVIKDQVEKDAEEYTKSVEEDKAIRKAYKNNVYQSNL